MLFNDFFRKNNLKNKATSNIKTQQIISSLFLSDVRIYLSDCSFESDIGIVSIHPTKGTRWFEFKNGIYIDSYGCVPPKKRSKFNIKRNERCFF